jgi:DNA-directed RNA polymerase subunit F
MGIVEVKTTLTSWLKNRSKSELISILLANSDHINVFAEQRDSEIGRLREELWELSRRVDESRKEARAAIAKPSPSEGNRAASE